MYPLNNNNVVIVDNNKIMCMNMVTTEKLKTPLCLYTRVGGEEYLHCFSYSAKEYCCPSFVTFKKGYVFL